MESKCFESLPRKKKEMCHSVLSGASGQINLKFAWIKVKTDAT